MSGIFTVGGLSEQIREHIAHRGNSDTVNVLWAGHLLALLAFGGLEIGEFEELYGLLKDVGREELVELYMRLSGEKPEDIRRTIQALAAHQD
jgi:hypothetical protein